MIKLQDLAPEVYYKQSRDFQFIGRLYDIVLNSVKTNADILYSLPFNDDSPDDIADLLSSTLGFKLKHNYTAKQLKTLCSVLPLALRNKGNINSLLYVANAIIHASGSDQAADYSLEDNNKHITLYLPNDFSDITLLKDVFEYVLPAGLSCDMIQQIVFKAQVSTEIGTTDIIEYKNLHNTDDTSDDTSYYDTTKLSLIPKVTYVYIKVETEPDDFETNFMHYYLQDENNKYIVVTAPIWNDNISYYKLDPQWEDKFSNARIGGTEGLLANTLVYKADLPYILLITKPAD